MASSWHVRLEGGPFDGDNATVDWPGPVSRLWCIWCDNCDTTHWFKSRHDGGEIYVLDEEDQEQRRAKYIHADSTLDGMLELNEQELLHA